MKYHVLGIFLLCTLCHAGPQMRDRIDGDWYPDTESPNKDNASPTPAPAGGAPPSQDNSKPVMDSGKMKPKSSKGNKNGNQGPSNFQSITVGDTESNSNSSTTYFHQSKNENTRSKWTHFTFPQKGGKGGRMGQFPGQSPGGSQGPQFQPPQGAIPPGPQQSADIQSPSPQGAIPPGPQQSADIQSPPPQGPTPGSSQPPGNSQVAPITQAPVATTSASGPKPGNGSAPNQQQRETKQAPAEASNSNENDNDNDSANPGLSSMTVGDTEGTSNSSTLYFNDETEAKTNSKWTNFAFPQTPNDDNNAESSENSNGNGGGQDQNQGSAPGQGQGQGPPGAGQMSFPFAGGFPHNMFGQNFFGGGGPGMFQNGNMGNGQNNFNG